MIESKTPDRQKTDPIQPGPVYWVPVVAWVGFLFMMSTGAYSMQSTSSIIEPLVRFFLPSISAEALDMLHSFIRKLAHVTEYSIFGMLLFRAFRGGSHEPRAWRWAWSALLVLVVFAVMDEIHQTLEPERTGSVVDVIIDASGGMASLSLCLWWFYRRHRREPSK